MNKVKPKKAVQEALQAVRHLKSLGYSKVSIIGKSLSGKLIPVCLRCDFSAFAPRGVHAFAPARKDERALIYYLCPFCEEEISKMPEKARNQEVDMLDSLARIKYAVMKSKDGFIPLEEAIRLMEGW